MMEILKKITGLFIIASLLISCHSGGNQESSSQEDEDLVLAPRFNEDSAYSFVEKQVDFGPRIPNTPEHKQCADWMIDKMKSYSDSVTVQKATIESLDKSYECINIIGHFNPQSKERILLLAHWDTRAFADADPETEEQHFDGADDGGSGVGVLLELARQFKKQRPEVGVDILLSDLEDIGVNNVAESWGVGTQYWSKQAKRAGYKAKYGILLDMVGGKNARFFREGVTRRYADAQSQMVWNTANRIGYSDFFRYRVIGDLGITDDHEFVNQILGVPTMDIIGLQGNGNFMPWHHQVTDNMKIIDRATLKAVGQTVMQVVYSNPMY